MRTSLIEIEQIERHLSKQNSTGDALLFEANLILDPNLKSRMNLQQHAYSFIEQYGRKQLREEIEAVHHQLFNHRQHQSFRQKIARIFSGK